MTLRGAHLFPMLKETKGPRKFLRGKLLPVHNPNALPKRIYIYWQQGLENAPELVRHCVDSWKAHHPEWDVVVLDAAGAEQWLSQSSLPDGVQVHHYSDLLRVALLSKTGGVWVDATTLCLRPLDDWLPLLMNQTDTFLFQRPSDDRMIASWFLAAAPGSYLVETWLTLSLDYLRDGPSDRPYFWFHYLFEYMIRRDRRAADAFRAIPALSADPQHILQRYMWDPGTPDIDIQAAATTPMQKLTWKQGHSVADVEAALGRI